MMGMQTMSGAVEPLRENEFFVSMLTMFSNPLMGILVGIAFTAVLQSASAAVGVLQALSVTGILTFASAFPIVLGIGVGAACPVLISSIGANKNGKRTALIYLLNDLFGMIFWGIVFYAANECYYIKNNSLCGLGQTAPNPVLSTLRYFKNEYIAHVKDKRCPAGVCQDLLTYKIIDLRCKGCTACARGCPVGAISGTVKQPHSIDTTKCIKCGACMAKCKFGAIIKE